MLEFILFTMFGAFATSAYYQDNPVIETKAEERVVTELKVIEIEVPVVKEKIVYKEPRVSCKLIIEKD
jgi:hypothetical protein